MFCGHGWLPRASWAPVNHAKQVWPCKAPNGTVAKMPCGTKKCEICYSKCVRNVLLNENDEDKVESENGVYGDPCIVNNLLCFVKCKMDIIQTDLLVKVCADTFSDTYIAEARALLYRFVKPSERLQNKMRMTWSQKHCLIFWNGFMKLIQMYYNLFVTMLTFCPLLMFMTKM